MWKGTKSLQPQTEENQGRKPEPAKDKVRFVMRVFSFCTLPEPGVRASALASMKASFTSGSSQLTTIQQRGSRETSGGHEREGGREEGAQGPLLTLRYTKCLSLSQLCLLRGLGMSQAKEGATMVSFRSCASKSLSSPLPSWPWYSHHKLQTHDTSSSNPEGQWDLVRVLR